jgi:hypothetical protein
MIDRRYQEMVGGNHYPLKDLKSNFSDQQRALMLQQMEEDDSYLLNSHV